ncbi:MAG: Gfo/Idh/MocA family protein [Candidatus Bathyarchaeia archaeon]
MKVGHVGVGIVGLRRARVVREHPDTSSVIVADVDIEQARKAALEIGCDFTADWKEVVTRRDIDLVIVSTPTNLLAPISIAAMENGKHVLCEKPLGMNPEEVERMAETARANNVKLKAGFTLRHHPAISKAKALVSGGAIGEIDFVNCRYGHTGRPGYDKEWRLNQEMTGGGQLLDQGIHAVDLFRWFVGDFVEVTGLTATRFWNTALEDNATALFKTKDRQIASLHVSWTRWRNLFSFEVFGHEGYLIVEGIGGSYGKEKLIRGWIAPPNNWPPKEEVTETPDPTICWRHEWDEFVNAIREDREPIGNGYDGLQAIRLVYDVYTAQRTGRIVKLTSRVN